MASSNYAKTSAENHLDKTEIKFIWCAGKNKNNAYSENIVFYTTKEEMIESNMNHV